MSQDFLSFSSLSCQADVEAVISSCKRTAHYGCLEPVQFHDAETTMSNHTLSYYKDGVCHDCHKFDNQWAVQLDVILGWRESEKASRALTGERVKDRKTGKEYVLPNAKDLTSPAEVCFRLFSSRLPKRVLISEGALSTVPREMERMELPSW